MLMSWFFSGQLEMVPLFSTRFLEMLAETTIGWLLLEQAILGEQKRAELPEGHTDHAFYLGKHFIATLLCRQRPAWRRQQGRSAQPRRPQRARHHQRQLRDHLTTASSASVPGRLPVLSRDAARYVRHHHPRHPASQPAPLRA